MREPVSIVVMSRANLKVAVAKRQGIPVESPCGRCGTVNHIHTHHEDCSKPLDVIWLCRKCHRHRHKGIGKPLVKCGFNLRIADFDADLMARLKAAAALSRILLKILCSGSLPKDCEPERAGSGHERATKTRSHLPSSHLRKHANRGEQEHYHFNQYEVFGYCQSRENTSCNPEEGR